MLIIFKSNEVFGWRQRVPVAMPNLPCMWDFRVVKARTCIGRASSVHGGLRTQRRCHWPTLCWWLCACTREVLERCRVCHRVVRGEEGGRFFFDCPTFLGFGIPLCSVELSPLSCGAVLLERGCVLLGVRVSSAMRFHGVEFADCVSH